MDKYDKTVTVVKKQPFYSVIIPMYNVSNLICKCLDSIYAQDMPEDEYEVIVVDDCSTDNSTEIVKRYVEKHRNTTLLLHKENKRQGGARNTAIRKANGKYIFFLDSDDCWLLTNVLTTFRKIIEQSNADIVDNVECKRIDYNQDIELSHYNEKPTYHEISTYDLLNCDDLSLSPWNAIYNRKMITNNNVWFAEHVQYEDVDWRMRIVYYAKTIVRTNLPFYCYRANPASTLNMGNARLQYDAVRCYIRLIDFASRDIHPKMKRFLGEWTLRNITAFPFLSRKYKIQDSLKATSELCKSGLLDTNTYTFLSAYISISQKSYIILFLLKHVPYITIAPYRALMRIKEIALRRQRWQILGIKQIKG